MSAVWRAGGGFCDDSAMIHSSIESIRRASMARRSWNRAIGLVAGRAVGNVAVVVIVAVGFVLGVGGIAGCGDDGGGADAAGDLQFFQTCGDPVCGTYTPTPGATLCSDEVVGEPCAVAGAACEIPDDGCNADIVCAAMDPATNCPISRRRFKRAIRYLDGADRAALYDQVRSIRLARYHYAGQPADARRLGFIIEDHPDSPAVVHGGDRVDVYAYASMAVAALQVQAETIEALGARVEALEAELKASRRSRSAP